MDDFEPIPSSPPGDHELSGNNPFDIRYNNGSYPRSNSLSSSQAHFHNHHHAYHQSSSSTSTTTPSGTNNFKSNPLLTYDVEIDMNDIPTLNQQPLALGFYVSTIGTLNPLPSWMLSNGHRLQRRSAKASSVFKATLHINVPHGQHTDEMLFAHNHESKVTHPLDSNYTYVVLRQETLVLFLVSSSLLLIFVDMSWNVTIVSHGCWSIWKATNVLVVCRFIWKPYFDCIRPLWSSSREWWSSLSSCVSCSLNV